MFETSSTKSWKNFVENTLHRALQTDEMNLNHLREMGEFLLERLQDCTMTITAVHRVDEVETRHSGRRYARTGEGC